MYRIKDTRKDFKFTLQCYDRDFFDGNDLIGENSLDLKKMLEDSALTKKPMCFNKKFYEWLSKEQPGFQKIKFDDKDPC